MIAIPAPAGTQAVARALGLLKSFSDARPEWRLSELARAARLHKATAHRLLAALPQAERKGILGTRTRLARHTERTITSAAALARELAEVGHRGYATAYEELERGYVAVGAAVCDHEGRPIAAVSVGGPTVRLPVSRFPAVGRQVKAAAARISGALGFRA